MDVRRNVSKVLICPCCNVLKESIRILRCGHSLCSGCLHRRLISNLQEISDEESETESVATIDCPVCHLKIKSEVKKLNMRNSAAERIVKLLLQNTEAAANEPITSLSRTTRREILKIAMHHKKAGNYDCACLLLRLLFGQCNGSDLFQLYAERIKCLLATNKLKEARQDVRSLSILVDEDLHRYGSNLKESYSSFPSDLTELLKGFTCRDDLDVAAQLAQNLIQVTKTYYSALTLLEEFHEVFLTIHANFPYKQIRKQPFSGEKYERIIRYPKVFRLMSDIVSEVQQIQNISSHGKHFAIAQLLLVLGSRWDLVEDYFNSSLCYSQATVALETDMLTRCIPSEVHGDCYLNLGVALERLGKLSESKDAYEKAIKLYQKSNLFSRNEQRDIDSVRRKVIKVRIKLVLRWPFHYVLLVVLVCFLLFAFLVLFFATHGFPVELKKGLLRGIDNSIIFLKDMNRIIQKIPDTSEL